MIKALNLQPGLVTDPAVQADLTEPGFCDAVVTWAPSPLLIEQGRESWAQSDAAVEWVLSHGKRCFVASPSSQFLPGAGYADRLRWVCQVIERYPQASIIVSNEPTFAGVSHEESAQMIRDTGEHAASLKPGAGSTHLLGPAEADAVVVKDGKPARLAYTPGVLGWLKGYRPPKGVRVDIAQHHYWDGTHGGAVATRLALAALPSSAWRPNLFLTEGFFIYATHKLPDWDPANPANPATWDYTNLAADEAIQLQRVTRHYQWCAEQPRMAMWTLYEDVDSMWGGWCSGSRRHADGSPHPVRAEWVSL